MPVNVTSLSFYITTNPKSLALAGLDDGRIAAVLNTIGITSETVEVSVVSNADIQSAVVGSEYVALTATGQRAWGLIVGIDSIPVKDQNIRNQVLAIWGPGTTTRSNLGALQTKVAAPSEVEFGENTFVTQRQVAIALRE